jgi:hypothetical protein
VVSTSNHIEKSNVGKAALQLARGKKHAGKPNDSACGNLFKLHGLEELMEMFSE